MNKKKFFIELFDDYHEIEYLGNMLKKHMGWEYKELGFEHRSYIGLFWVGIQPNINDVANQLSKLEIRTHIDLSWLKRKQKQKK